MAQAQGILSGMSYVAEVTYGTTPATPQMINTPQVSTTLDQTSDIINDATILPDRMEVDEKQGNRHVGGNIVVTDNYTQFDDWKEAVLGGTWTTNVLKVGANTPRSFTLEQSFGDITQYRRFTGMRFNSFELQATTNAAVVTTYNVMGKAMTTSQTALDSTPTASLAKPMQIAIGGTMTIGGSTVNVTSFTLTHTNNMQDLFTINSSSALNVNWQEAMTTGQIVLYFEDLVAYNRYLNETTAAIVFSSTDGTNGYTYTVPKAKFNTATLPVPGAGVLFVTLTFKALKDSVSGTTFQIARA